MASVSLFRHLQRWGLLPSVSESGLLPTTCFSKEESGGPRSTRMVMYVWNMFPACQQTEPMFKLPSPFFGFETVVISVPPPTHHCLQKIDFLPSLVWFALAVAALLFDDVYLSVWHLCFKYTYPIVKRAAESFWKGSTLPRIQIITDSFGAIYHP